MGVGPGRARQKNLSAAGEVDEGQTPPATLPEGALRRVTVNAYERSTEARRRCLAHYGTACVVCGTDLGRTYGEAAQGFVHVHHLRPLSEVGRAYEVDPIADLRPVCPNCHAVIHLRSPAYSVDEVRGFLRRSLAAQHS